jgi:hypothetical protein
MRPLVVSAAFATLFGIMLFIHHPTSAAFAPVSTHRGDRGAWPWRQPA